jgi:hypothetical protein
MLVLLCVIGQVFMQKWTVIRSFNGEYYAVGGGREFNFAARRKRGTETAQDGRPGRWRWKL